MSWPPTLADSEVRWEHARVAREDAGDTVTVEAPCCGRICADDMVVDVRGVSGIGRDWMCDGCRWRFIRSDDNPWRRSSFNRALGAPPKDVRSARVKELVAEAEKRAVENDEVFIPEDARIEARNQMPDDGMPAGSELPA